MTQTQKKNHPYKRCVMGGTFDRFHMAHRSLLQTAAHMAEEVFVGIVSEELGKEMFRKKEYGEHIQDYDTRASTVRDFLSRHCDKAEVEPLYDPWGPAPVDPDADVIVVSYETVDNAHRINEMRRENGLDLLDIVVIPWIYVGGELISSTRKRREELEQNN